MTSTGPIDDELRTEFLARNWASPTYAAMSVEFVDAILARVWQGKKPHVRDHMLDVCAQVSRRFGKPWMDEQIQRAKAEAWDAGFTRGFYDVLAGSDRDASESTAVNPHETPP